MAAALPLALAFGGVSLWGIAQKHKAEDLASSMARKDLELALLAATVKHQEEHAPHAAAQPQPLLAAHRKPARTLKGKELVIPVERPESQIPQGTQAVKDH